MPTTITKADFDLAKQFIRGDIHREVELAKAWHDPARRPHLEASDVHPSGAGNLLAALGLLCYTEFCGWLKFNCRKNDGSPAPKQNFNAFFDTLGSGMYYAAFRAQHNVYDIFRCGMAHEYFVKRDFTIYMLDGGGANIGIAYDVGTKHYDFIVERYHLDLSAALTRLETELTPLFPLTR
jgi:hypothetical protein